MSVALCLVACHEPPRAAVERATEQLADGHARWARRHFDEIVTRADATPSERVEALTGAALACERLGDRAGALSRLESAVAAEVPGSSEPALFYLAEQLRTRDRARALNLYYRAAAGAEHYRRSQFPYQDAMSRILQLSR